TTPSSQATFATMNSPGTVEANFIPSVIITGPSAAQVVQGLSTSFVFTITGAPQLVAFSVTGLPLSAIPSWTPNQVTDSLTGVSDTMTISVPATTATGSYTAILEGKGTDGQVGTMTFTLSVVAPFDFTMTFNPSSASIPPGSNQNIVATITSTSTLSSAVSIEISGLPSGLSDSFPSGNSYSPNPSCAITFSLSASAS